MPSTRMRSVKILNDTQRGQNYIPTAEVIVTAPLVAADFTGANSGKFVFIAPADMMFLGIEEVHGSVGTNNFRVKKVLAAATSAAGAAADANNVDISGTVDLTAAVNVRREAAPVMPGARLAAGDKVAVASAAGTTGLAGAVAVLRFAFV